MNMHGLFETETNPFLKAAIKLSLEIDCQKQRSLCTQPLSDFDW